MFSRNNTLGLTAKDYEIDTSNVPKELEGKYEIELESGDKIKGFSPEFLDKISQFGVSEKVISIISSGMQDRNGNITGGAHLEIGKIRGTNFQVTNEVHKTIRVTPKNK